MSFVSFEFLIFIIIVFGLFWFIPDKYRWRLLLLSSYVFYGFAGIQYILLLIYVSVTSFFFPLLVKKGNRHKVFICVLSIVTVLVPLMFFKYTGFLQENINVVLDSVGSAKQLSVMAIALPLGISFYTFSALGYVIDVITEKIEPERNFWHYATGISFFPCMVSGPIERQNKLIPQILAKKIFDYNQVTYGLKLIAWGLYKKTVIADSLAVYVDAIWKDLRSFEGITLLIGVLFYSIQIYCDFSGYSDMAKGIAYLFGIELTTNFKNPYFSSSIQEFWKRWHISLSTWFRDYVYIKLGGSKRGKFRKALNIVVTMLISGLWHGAAWKYVVWGGTYGLLQATEMFVGNNKEKEHILVLWLKRLLIFAICSVLWVFFRSDTFSDALFVVTRMLTFKYDFNVLVSIGLPMKAIAIVVSEVIFLFAYDYISLEKDVIKKISSFPIYVRWPIYVVFVIIIAQFSYKGSAGNFVYAGF